MGKTLGRSYNVLARVLWRAAEGQTVVVLEKSSKLL
jgi:hypothetical protein